MSIRRIATVALALSLSMVLVHAQQGTPTPTPSPAPSATPAAGSLSGSWTGTMKDTANNREQPVLLILKQDGDIVTGGFGPDADRQLAISKAKVVTTKDGTSVTFDVEVQGTLLAQVDLKLVDGHLKGDVKSTRGTVSQLDVTRAK